ncbi:MBL fold metallo-hydrolase [Brevibacillus laterosporus]|uniref:MBL fold metallo-hydrolase n=1 Tax=Brevibacillus laterosporus TaxID=1465 RepID=UPI00264C6246|nr:MBL fold metallo-hydrolase [Brevibacillus laterosporus]MDN9011249.1 MBL fold metallo-hydrolase [Brevibacillus laterosporus]MDO0942272.1 MBL fold metallo-hydrolase [Brevibacillus laterosporus]
MSAVSKKNRLSKAATEMAKGVYQISLPTPFAVGDVNVYVLEGQECITLVDVGPLTEEAWSRLENGLASIGYHLEDVGQIVLTHHHVDHIGQLEKVKHLSQAKVYAHPLAAPYVEQDEEFMQFHDEFFITLYKECGLPEELLSVVEKFRSMMATFQEKSKVDESLVHEQDLPRFPEWQVLFTPGHSQSHLSLYRASDQLLIAGDHLISSISSNAFIEPPRDRSMTRPLTLVQYRTALEMCAGMDIKLVVSGHGEPIENSRELIFERLQKTWERTNAIRRFLLDGPKTAFELAVLLFPLLYLKELPLVISETLGHIDLLVMVQQIHVQNKEGVLYYSL